MHLGPSSNKGRPGCWEPSSQENPKEISLPPFFSSCPQKEQASQADCSFESQKPIPSPSTSALQLLGKSPHPRGPGHSEGCRRPGSRPRSSVWEQQREPRRGAGSPETCCQQPGQLAGNSGGSLQMPRKPPFSVPLRLGGDPGITRALVAASHQIGR